MRIVHLWLRAALLAFVVFASGSGAAQPDSLRVVDDQIAAHPDATGVYVLDTGDEALLARAWLVDHAERSIEVQYFIWSTDNIGILAAEALLRAAGRGVHVRVLVDDLLIDAPDKSLLALEQHPNIEIRVYNPKHSVGVPLPKRVLNMLTDFRGFNQRMHDKTLVVDGKIAIVGGRNMAAEYFDYHHDYNFRDRDLLMIGKVPAAVRASFERFWGSPLCVAVSDRYDGLGLLQKNLKLKSGEAEVVYRELSDYAKNDANFAPEVRAAIDATPKSFDRLTKQLVWTDVAFISDRPGKNDNRILLGGGGATASALARLVDEAKNEILIQSPYLVLTDEAIALFKRAIARGVSVSVSTNSLASTDNLPAFSGYRNQRAMLIEMGINVAEYRPDPAIRKQLIERALAPGFKAPTFALHAKTMVIDSEITVVGTFNLDPRSENLNTEVGAIVRNQHVAARIAESIRADMAPGSSWNAARDNPDQFASQMKRAKVRMYQFAPITPLL